MKSTLPLLLVLATGCEDLQQFVPTVQFDRFAVRSIDFQDADVDFVFRVDNPNPVEIQLASFSYALDFEQVPILSGDNPDGFGLEAMGASELALPVNLVWKDAWDLVQATRGKDDIGFGLAGDFGFDTPIGEVVLGYDESGQFPALRTPKFSFQRLRVAKLDLIRQEATIALDLAVDNEHASTLDFLDVDYDVSLAGSPVATGTIPTLGSVDGATTGTLTVPLTIDLTRVGIAVVDAFVAKTPLRVGLGADMDVETPFGLVPLTIAETGTTTVE